MLTTNANFPTAFNGHFGLSMATKEHEKTMSILKKRGGGANFVKH